MHQVFGRLDSKKLPCRIIERRASLPQSMSNAEWHLLCRLLHTIRTLPLRRPRRSQAGTLVNGVKATRSRKHCLPRGRSRYFNAPREEVRISLFRFCQPPAPLRKSDKALKEFLDITRSHGLRLPTADHGRLVALCLCFLHAREPAGIPWKPKVLLAVHLVLSAGRFGYPRLLGNWIDESDNRELSLVASAAAPIWHKRILSILHTNRDLPLRRPRRSQKH